MSIATPRERAAGADAFDFLWGDWRVRHRRLRQRLAGSSDWAEFAGTMHAGPILEGLGNFDRNVIDLPEGSYHACTLRLFQPGTRLWSIHWIDGRDPKLDPPVTGGFEGGRGIFLGEDLFEGKPIQLRFLWSGIGGTSARWEQAFSADQGASWETNWIMDFTRA